MGALSFAVSVAAPLASKFSKVSVSALRTVSGSIILSAVSLVNAVGSCRARKKSSGPRGRPGSEDNIEVCTTEKISNLSLEVLAGKERVSRIQR